MDSFVYMSATVFLFTPPFTQLNTPYPATAYLKGFLNTKDISSFQADLGIETTLAIFCRNGLASLFSQAAGIPHQALSPNTARILSLKEEYFRTIDDVILFLQGKNPTLAHWICKRDLLPEASRFSQVSDLEWAFGSMGIQDRAKHFATMYLEDLADMIKECIDPHFGFSRYAEKMARSANSFDELYESLRLPHTYVDNILTGILNGHLKNIQPALVAISVPLPGNLYSALTCGQWIKQNYPSVKVVMGGGFANTELRSLTDPRVFECVDYITLDDGEAPLECLVKHVNGQAGMETLKRTFVLQNDKVCFISNNGIADYKQAADDVSM